MNPSNSDQTNYTRNRLKYTSIINPGMCKCTNDTTSTNDITRAKNFENVDIPTR